MLEQILKSLVEVPSVSGDRKTADEAIRVVRDYLKPTVFKCETGADGSYPYLVACTQEPDADTVWFICHLDVVPGEDKLFKLRSDAGKYYGRGVFDMKGMAAAVLAAATKADKKSNVGLMFTTDEEVGGQHGVGYLVSKGFKGSAAYVFDQSADWVLQEKMKGVIWLSVEAEGKSAHGARPWLGKSANQGLVSFLHDFTAWFDENIEQDHPENYFTTYNIGTISGGLATNQVSAHAEATIDIRYAHDKDAADIISAAQHLANETDGVSVKIVMREHGMETDVKEKWFMKTKELMDQIGLKPGKAGERFGHGSTDGRYLAPTDTTVISTRPPGGKQHGPDEWVSKQGLQDLQTLCEKIIKESTK